MTGKSGHDAALRVRCRSTEEAERLRRALAADDPGQASIRRDGPVLLLAAESSTALGLLRTLDDLLGCLRAAEPDL